MRSTAMASIYLSEADPDVRRLLVVLLDRLGHEVIVLGGGAAAPPPADLLLLEPASPECVEQARIVRAQQPSIPVICVSILPPEACFLSLGPLAYLAKPFALDQLSAAVDAVLVSPADLAA
jgi:DNA-binding response OmpR family regulator